MKSQSFGHACAFFDSPRDESRSALPWLARGLARGERLLLFVEPDKQDYWRAAFAGFAIDASLLEEKGSIVFHGQLSDEPGHEFNSLRTASSLWSVIEQSLPGYAGLRLLIDMQWTQDTGLPADKLCHWEATLEYLLSDVATVQAMCQYDRRLPPAALHAALRTHPYSLYGGRSAPSPFYEAARVLEDEPNFEPCSNDASLVGQMLREVHPDLT